MMASKLLIIAVALCLVRDFACPMAVAGPVFDKASPGLRLRYGPPYYVSTEVVRRSPDKRYVARLICGDGEIGYLAVYRRGAGDWKLNRLGRLSRVFADVHGCAWIPHHGHWLVVSTGGADYGPGMLALWTGPGQTRLLRHARSSVGDGFMLRTVAADGRRITYRHDYQRFTPGDPNPGPEHRTIHTLRLPRA